MIYAMSDIHGQYEQFLTLLEQIGIRKEDTLYILGDVVDRGPEPMKILKYMMAHSNIIPIIGNHEVMALPNLKLLVPEISGDFLDKLPSKVYQDFADWTQNGSTSTIQDFRKLPPEERHQVVQYMKSFRPYGKEIVNGQEYWLVHAGLDHFSETKRLEEYSVEDLVWTRIDYEIPYFNDIIVVSGIHRHRISLGTATQGIFLKQTITLRSTVEQGKAMEDWRQSAWIPGKNIMRGKCCKEQKNANWNS